MIEITRNTARQVRAVFRRSAWPACDRRSPPPIVFRADGQHLTIFSTALEIGAAFIQAAAADTIILPGRALADFEGRDGSPVLLERVASEKVRVRWHDRGILVTNTYDVAAPDPPPAFPPAPDTFTPQPPAFLAAFDEAAKTVLKGGTRPGLGLVQLRGRKGSLVATDGRQLLIHEGFAFPWSEDVLVPPRLPPLA